MKGKIVLIKKVYDEFNNCLGYEVTIEYEEEPKNLHLGECEVKQ